MVLREHPRDRQVFDNFKERFVGRICTASELSGIEDMAESCKLNDPNEEILPFDYSQSDLQGYDGFETSLGRMAKFLIKIPEEKSREFFGYLLNKIPGENIDFIPNGGRVSKLVYETLSNRWFVPKKLSRELQPVLDEITRKFDSLNMNSRKIRETYCLDDAINVAYGYDGSGGPPNEDFHMGIMFMNDQERIRKSLKKVDLKIKRSKYEKTFDDARFEAEKLERMLNIEAFLTAFGKEDEEDKGESRNAFIEFGDMLSKPRDFNLGWARQNLAWNISRFVEGIAAYSIKDYMKKQRKNIENGISGDLFFDGRDMYDEHYSFIVARDIAEYVVRNYGEFLVLENLIPQEDRFCLSKYLFEVAKQGYWLSGFSKSENDSKKAVLWHI